MAAPTARPQGYGAGAVNPYVAFETIADLYKEGLLPRELGVEQAKKKLQDAKAAVQAQRRPRAGASAQKLDPAAARARLNTMLEQDPATKTKLTMAARKGEGLSDADVQGMLEDLEELGIRLPSDKLDD